MKESEQMGKFLDLGGAEKDVEHEDDGDTNQNFCTWGGP